MIIASEALGAAAYLKSYLNHITFGGLPSVIGQHIQETFPHPPLQLSFTSCCAFRGSGKCCRLQQRVHVLPDSAIFTTVWGQRGNQRVPLSPRTQEFQQQEEQEGTRGGPRGRGAAGHQSNPSVCSAGFMLTQEAFNYLGFETEQLIISPLQRFIDLPETFATV